MLKTKLKRPILNEFPGYWWLFDCNTYCVTALGCLKKKEDEQFRFSTVSGQPSLEQVLDIITVTVDQGSLYKFFYMLVDTIICCIVK